MAVTRINESRHVDLANESEVEVDVVVVMIINEPENRKNDQAENHETQMAVIADGNDKLREKN